MDPVKDLLNDLLDNGKSSDLGSVAEIESTLQENKLYLRQLAKLSFDPDSYQEEILRIQQNYQLLLQSLKNDQKKIFQDLQELDRLNKRQTYVADQSISFYEFYY